MPLLDGKGQLVKYSPRNIVYDLYSALTAA